MSAVPEQLAAALAERYRIERELGQGGMATVYLAEDLKHQRQVAVKVLKPELAMALGAERFLAEIRVTATLQHPNLLPLFDSGAAGGFLFYVMPYLEGETLRARVAGERQLPVEETIRLVGLLAGALDFAHGRGVIHRDLKPDNILLQAGQPVIADFGIALAIAQAGGDRVTETGLSLGTPQYMSPEQAAGTHTVDARSDQYALGAVTYEMLTGEPPHSGATSQAIIARLMTETPRSIRAVRPAVPEAVEVAVQRALAKPPADRFASCGAFAEALASGARTGGSAAAAGGLTPTPASRTRRLAPVAALLAVVVLVAAGVAFARRSATGADAAPPSSDKSLAVLPFSSVGGDTANAYFAAGIADELTTALAQIPGLRLAGRSSAARVKDRGDGAREIGTTLDVGAVLDGSVRRSGERIRVTAELTSAADGRVLWRDTYERELKDVFDVQDDIARAIVAALQVRLTAGAASAPGVRGGTSDLAAYDLYLRALQLYRGRGDGLLLAERFLRDATARDPNYARAEALLASVLLVQPYYVDVRQFGELLPEARAAAQRAVALDGALAEAHVVLGHAAAEAFEWDEAERELRRGIELDPQSAEGQYRLGYMLLNAGRVREAVAPLAEANRLDPLYTVASSYLGWALAMSGRVDEGLVEAKRAAYLAADLVGLDIRYANTLELAGQLDEAAVASRAQLRRTDDARTIGLLARLLAAAGARDEATAILRRLEEKPAGAKGRDAGLFYIRLGLGDLDGALDALESAAPSTGQGLVAAVFASPYYDPLRRNPRFAAVLRGFNFDVARLTLPDGGRLR